MSDLKKTQVALVVNQDAGKAASRMKVLRKLARSHKLKLRMCDGSDLDYTLREVLSDKKLKRLIVGGGDGTVSLAASLIRRINPKVELAVLPVGTANYYAKSLGVNRSISKSFDVALGENTSKRYLCSVNKRDFLIGVNIGNTSRMFDEVTDEEKQKLGRFAYIRGLFRVFLSIHNYDLIVEANNERSVFISTELAIVNQYVSGPVKLLPDVEGSKPYFEIVTYGLGNSKLSPWIGVLIFSFTFGKNKKYFKRIKTTKARISSKKPQTVAVDGDSLEETPLEVELLKKPIVFVRA